MDDLISRRATIQAIDDYTKGKPLYEYPYQLIEVIRNVPSAEKTGKWRDYPIADGCLQCSNCGVLRMGEPSNYCPNCGTRMVEE